MGLKDLSETICDRVGADPVWGWGLWRMAPVEGVVLRCFGLRREEKRGLCLVMGVRPVGGWSEPTRAWSRVQDRIRRRPELVRATFDGWWRGFRVWSLQVTSEQVGYEEA